MSVNLVPRNCEPESFSVPVTGFTLIVTAEKELLIVLLEISLRV